MLSKRTFRFGDSAVKRIETLGSRAVFHGPAARVSLIANI